jgi:hypothetical protein
MALNQDPRPNNFIVVQTVENVADDDHQVEPLVDHRNDINNCHAVQESAAADLNEADVPDGINFHALDINADIFPTDVRFW